MNGRGFSMANNEFDRRSFLGKVAGGIALIGAGTVLGGTAARAQTDSDPTDASGRGRATRATDSDPTDAGGRGRGRNTGRNDSDPTDTPGTGRSGTTDSDPTDGGGRGRGARARDNDPTDPAARRR
jgi:hypothetical protein